MDPPIPRVPGGRGEDRQRERSGEGGEERDRGEGERIGREEWREERERGGVSDAPHNPTPPRPIEEGPRCEGVGTQRKKRVDGTPPLPFAPPPTTWDHTQGSCPPFLLPPASSSERGEGSHPKDRT